MRQTPPRPTPRGYTEHPQIFLPSAAVPTTGPGTQGFKLEQNRGHERIKGDLGQNWKALERPWRQAGSGTVPGESVSRCWRLSCVKTSVVPTQGLGLSEGGHSLCMPGTCCAKALRCPFLPCPFAGTACEEVRAQETALRSRAQEISPSSENPSAVEGIQGQVVPWQSRRAHVGAGRC